MDPPNAQHLILLPGKLSICQLPPGAAIPSWTRGEGLWMVLDAPDELTVVCRSDRVPPGVRAEAGWRAFQVAGPLEFTLVGILASLTAPLAEAGVSVFALSSYNTDYLLVPEKDLHKARDALRAAGHTLAGTGGATDASPGS